MLGFLREMASWLYPAIVVLTAFLPALVTYIRERRSYFQGGLLRLA